MKVVPSHLPGEIIDNIVKYLLSDRRAAASCALICKAWVPWSRSYVFSDIQLTGFCQDSKDIRLLPLLQSPVCTFLPFVRRLVFYPLSHLFRRDHAIVMNALDSKRTRLGHKNSEKGSFFHKAKKSVAKAIGITEPPHHDLQSNVMNLVRLFPSVEHLQIDIQFFALKVAECTGLPPVPPTLQTLTVTSMRIGRQPFGSYSALPQEWTNLLDWVHRERVYNIRKLCIEELSAGSTKGVEALLEAQGNRIRCLEVRPWNSSGFYCCFISGKL
jgi:hypothetical protein